MGWASVRVEPEMQRVLDLLDVDDVAKTIRSELAELFPGTRFEVEAIPADGWVKAADVEEKTGLSAHSVGALYQLHNEISKKEDNLHNIDIVWIFPQISVSSVYNNGNNIFIRLHTLGYL